MSLRVHPVLIPKTEMIAKVDGVMNGISIVGDKVGETMYYGPGAGGDATASAVISDLIEIARGAAHAPMLGFHHSLERGLTLADPGEIITSYYFRLTVSDKAGVLEKIAGALADKNISIETMVQRNRGENATLFFTTHEAREADIQEALKIISRLDAVQTPPVMIRIEE